MKKKLAVAAVLLVTAGTLFAGEMAAGARGTLSLSGNKWADGDMKEAMKSMREATGIDDNRKSVMIGGGVDVFFRYDFLNIQIAQNLDFSLGVQPELGFHGGWGANEDISFGEIQLSSVDFTYNTLDIPILLTAGFKINNLKVNLAVGPNFGLVMGKAKFKMEFLSIPVTTVNTKVSPFLMGLQAGAGISYKFTEKHGITFDARGIFDFNDLKLAEEISVSGNDSKVGYPITRRIGLMLSLGYSYTF